MQGNAAIGRSVNPIRPADGVASQEVRCIRIIHRCDAYNSSSVCRCNAQLRGGVLLARKFRHREWHLMMMQRVHGRVILYEG